MIHIAGTLDDIAESTRVLAASLLVIAPAVAALLAVLVWWLVGRTLRPVEAIRAEVAAIGGADLERRVTVPPGDDEISGLARTMNGMLERVSTTVDRQRRFVADASHELRSPLTRIRSELEVDLAHPEVADPVATHRSVLEETVGLQRLVDDLLLLARSDANVPAPTVDEPVDLDDIVVRVARRAREEAPVAVVVSEVRALRTHGDVRQLTRAVANLTDNAVRHATSMVTLTLAREGDVAVLAVADDGPGIPADQRDRVFERFARLDEARPRADRRHRARSRHRPRDRRAPRRHVHDRRGAPSRRLLRRGTADRPRRPLSGNPRAALPCPPNCVTPSSYACSYGGGGGASAGRGGHRGR